MPLSRWTERVEADPRFDDLSDRLLALRPHAVRAGTTRDIAAGTWLGHALHPPLTDVPLGLWTSALLLDLLGRGRRWPRAAARLMGAGVVAATPVIVTGLVDLAEAPRRLRRVGAAHALANGAATMVFAASAVARGRDRQRAGIALGLLGGAVAAMGGYLGGHLSFGKGVGVGPRGTSRSTVHGERAEEENT